MGDRAPAQAAGAWSTPVVLGQVDGMSSMTLANAGDARGDAAVVWTTARRLTASAHLSGVHVVKAFNNIYFGQLATQGVPAVTAELTKRPARARRYRDVTPEEAEQIAQEMQAAFAG